jgi:multidrug efflux pump subunit AcrB
VLAGNQAIAVQTGPFLQSRDDVAELVVASRAGKPVYLREVATVRDGRRRPRATSGTARSSMRMAKVR